jgi:hypothetical protein
VVELEINRKDSINFTLRMQTGLRLDLAKIAAKENRNLTNLINMILSKYVEEYDKKDVKK